MLIFHIYLAQKRNFTYKLALNCKKLHLGAKFHVKSVGIYLQ